MSIYVIFYLSDEPLPTSKGSESGPGSLIPYVFSALTLNMYLVKRGDNIKKSRKTQLRGWAKKVPRSRNEIVHGDLALFGGLGLEPDVPHVAEVFEDVVLDLGTAVVHGGVPLEGAPGLRNIDHDSSSRGRGRCCKKAFFAQILLF